MILKKYFTPFPYLIVENMYDDDELNLIEDELNFLLNDYKTQNQFFLDDLYTHRQASNILQVNRKLFHQGYFRIFSTLSFGYKSILYQKKDYTRIERFKSPIKENRRDLANYTCLSYFSKFLNNKINFLEYDHSIMLENNTMILFPSFIEYQIETSEESFLMTQVLNLI
jgi:hypothetical protein